MAPQEFQEILWTFSSLTTDWLNLFDVVLVGLIVFALFQLVRGTRAATLLRGVAIVLVLVFLMSGILRLNAFSWLISRTLTALAVAVPVVFQDELRRWLDQVGRFGLFNLRQRSQGQMAANLITEICDTARILSQQRHGALVVIERGTGLAEYIESGTHINADVTSQLLQTIFYPKTSLHDGAVIIRDERIKAAACTLPVSSSRRLPDRRMGLRHRAALGIAEVSDAVTVVVSEESGRISVVVGGRFVRRGIDADGLAMVLGQYLNEGQTGETVAWLERLRQRVQQLQRSSEGS